MNKKEILIQKIAMLKALSGDNTEIIKKLINEQQNNPDVLDQLLKKDKKEGENSL
ncbi:MAG: hypothetical protein RSB71_01490 [Bacilli bacterium]